MCVLWCVMCDVWWCGGVMCDVWCVVVWCGVVWCGVVWCAEKFDSLTNFYCRNARAALVCYGWSIIGSIINQHDFDWRIPRALYTIIHSLSSLLFTWSDITDHSSFENLNHWVNKVRKEADDNCVMIIVGNKCMPQCSFVVFVDDEEKMMIDDSWLIMILQNHSWFSRGTSRTPTSWCNGSKKICQKCECWNIGGLCSIWEKYSWSIWKGEKKIWAVNMHSSSPPPLPRFPLSKSFSFS